MVCLRNICINTLHKGDNDDDDDDDDNNNNNNIQYILIYNNRFFSSYKQKCDQEGKDFKL